MAMMTLSQEMMEAGKKLVEHLDQRGEEVDAAFWFVDPETKSLKLVLSLPKAIRKGPREAYRSTQKSLRRLDINAFSLDSVTIARPQAPLVRLLRSVIKTGKGRLGSVRFTHCVINGVPIEDAYVYRLV